MVCVSIALACNRGAAPADVEPEGAPALAAPIDDGFEDGTLEGWVARGGGVVLTNTDEAAFAGNRSLKTTGRSQPFHGPSLSLLGQLTKGATYRVTVSARLAAGEAPTSMRVTMQRTPVAGGDQFDQIAFNASVTDGAWVTLSGTYSFATDVTGLLLYVEAASPTASYYIDGFNLSELAPPPLQADFEDGTLQGWTPRGGGVALENTTEAAFAGTRSLETTGRTAGFHGPSRDLLNQLTKGATYQVVVSARLLPGEAPTTLRVTMQRTPAGGGAQFDGIASNSNVTDAAWVTLTGIYSFATDVTGLLLYVEATSATASYYIDSFSITQLAPPPGPPGNTAGATASFETGTREGWFARTGTEVLTVTSADAHGGAFSLLTSNRTSAFRGPAYDVTNVMFNGSRYRIQLWAKLAPGEPDTQLRVSLERRLGTALTSFHTVVGNTTVTAAGWVLFAATIDVNLANTALTLYVESANGLASFHIDDFRVSFIPPPVAERDIPSVYQSLAAFFPVGAAVWQGDLTGEHAFLLTKHFNRITSENDMKWSALQPSEGSFTFGTADAQVSFAKANNMAVHGHTLIWHNQTPAWVFNDATGAPMTPTAANKALLLQRLDSHIRAVVTHFGADVPSWDVVNEVIDPAQPDGFRRSPWFDIIGPEFIDAAFRVAREAAPAAKLYINDFDTTNPTKRAFLHALISDLKGRGVPIDGIGHQMHNNVEFPSGQAVVDTINMFDALGVENVITELDVSIYSGSLPGPIADYAEIPADRLVMQGYRYRTFFQAFRQLQGKIKWVTLWGQADDHTWLTSNTRADAPLLFDIALKKKLAYWGVVDPLQLPGADLSTSISGATNDVPAGQTIAYTITVRNNADADHQPFQPADDDLPAANVSVTSAIPAHTAFKSLAAPSAWSCTTPAAGGTGQIRCTVDSLGVGASASFTLTVAVVDCATPDASSIVGAATVTSTTADPNPAPNNTASISVPVPPVIDLIDLTTRTPMSTFVMDGDAPDGRVLLLLPPNQQYQTFTLRDLIAGITDNCQGDLPVGDAFITQVTSDEPEDAPGGRDGSTLDDIVIGADCDTVQLRVERDSMGNGRVYTIGLRVRNAAGAATAATVKVIVPTAPELTDAVDDGPRYTVSSACQ
jgi:endo-1,4-beta-xylanase